MIRQQRWTPDTCANSATGDVCILIESWDDQVSAAARTHNFVRAEKLCTRHAAAHGGNHAAAFTANYEENRRKNTTLGIAQSVKAGLTPEQYQWSIRNDGVVLASFGANLTTNQKNQLQSNCDIQFGPGKVIVS